MKIVVLFIGFSMILGTEFNPTPPAPEPTRTSSGGSMMLEFFGRFTFIADD